MKVEVMNVAEINAETQEQGLAFKKLGLEEGAVYGILCPSIKRRKAESILADVDIPERVKEIVEMTKDRFRDYEVWESTSYTVKDPILIGRQPREGNDAQYDFYDTNYLLARWGEELEAFPVLFAKAKEMFKRSAKVKLLKARAEIDARLADIDLFIDESFSKGMNRVPSLDLGALE